MHAIIQPDGTYAQSKYLRFGSSVAFLLFAAGGVLLLLSPELVSIYRASGVWMTWFITVGAILSAVGALSRYWFGEFVGLPLLSFGFAILGFETWLNNHEKYPLLSAGNLCFLLAVAALLSLRWWMVYHVYRFVHEAALVEARIREVREAGA